jgi:hypothetical protein
MSNYGNETEGQPRLIKIYLIKPPDFGGEFGAPKKVATKKVIAKKPLAKKPANSQTIYATNYTVTAPTRRVSISGTAVVSDIGLETWSAVTAYLRQQFEKQGWYLSNFSLEEGSGIFSANVDINITAEVSNQYSNQEHLDQAYRIFNQYTINYYVTTNRPFSNVRLDITGTDKPNYAAPKTKTTSGTPKPNTGDDTTYTPPDAPFSLDKTLTDISKTLFGSFGTSTLLIAVVLGGIIVLKR